MVEHDGEHAGAHDAAPRPGDTRSRLLGLASTRIAAGAAGAVAGIVATALVAWAVWPDGGAFPGTVQDRVLSPAEASGVVGAKLTAAESTEAPPAALTADPEQCAAVVGPATRAAYGDGWTEFYSVGYQDSEAAAEHVVIQAIAAYPDRAGATQVVETLSKSLGSCDAATAGEASAAITWGYEVQEENATSVAWTSVFAGVQPWSCRRVVEVTETTVVQDVDDPLGAARQADVG